MRDIKESEKEKVLDAIMRGGAVVRQVYDYRVRSHPHFLPWEERHWWRSEEARNETDEECRCTKGSYSVLDRGL